MGERGDLETSSSGKRFENPRQSSWVEFPGLCPECNVITVACRTHVKEANFKFFAYLCCRRQLEEKSSVAVAGKPKREIEVDGTEDAVLGKKPKLEDVVSEDAK